jgi:hypothetical protein
MDSTRAPDQEYAEDVTDLREAQRMIAQLRRMLEQQSTLNSFADGEFTVFLDDRHTNMVMTLFEQQRLVAGQDAACELHDVLSDFVSHWLDVQQDIQQIERGRFPQQPQYITPTA